MATQDDDKKIDAATAFFVEHCKQFGASVLTVKDGHVLMFNRKYLQEILDKHPDAPQVMIHVKRPTFGD